MPKSAIRPGSIFNRQGGSVFNQRRQHNILNEVARRVDTGELRTTVGDNYGRINAENLRRAHALLESGKAKGKIVLEGF